ncbi:MAG: hypothetical protein U0183_23515 [Polyangiaceae bacterium]
MLPLLALGVGACRALLGIDDPGPAPDGPLSDATVQDAPADGALLRDGGAPDVDLDARVDSDGGADAGDPCEQRAGSTVVVCARFDAGEDAGYTIAGSGGRLLIRQGEATADVRTEANDKPLGDAYLVFFRSGSDLPATWTWATVDLDLTVSEIEKQSPGSTIIDTLLRVRAAQNNKEIRIDRYTPNAGSPRFQLDPGADLGQLPLTTPLHITLKVPFGAGSASVTITTNSGVLQSVTDGGALPSNPPSLEISLGIIQPTGQPEPPKAKYSFGNVVVRVQ